MVCSNVHAPTGSPSAYRRYRTSVLSPLGSTRADSSALESETLLADRALMTGGGWGQALVENPPTLLSTLPPSLLARAWNS